MIFNRKSVCGSLFLLGGTGWITFACGCASGPPASGFLTGYEYLKRSDKTARVWDYVDKGTGANRLKIQIWVDRRNLSALKNYDHILIDPLVFDFLDHGQATRIDVERRERGAEFDRQAILQRLGQRYPLVDEVGPGVLRIRQAITALTPQRVYQQPDRNKLPEKAFVNSRPGTLTTESELVDSVTGERLAAAVIHTRGSYLDLNAEQDIYKQARRGLRLQANLYRALLDQAHGVVSGSTSNETNGQGGSRGAGSQHPEN